MVNGFLCQYLLLSTEPELSMEELEEEDDDFLSSRALEGQCPLVDQCNDLPT